MTKHYARSVALFISALSACFIFSNAYAEKCTGRGPHVGVGGSCCGVPVRLSDCGFGFARDWDCAKGLAEGSPELRARVCRQLKEKKAVCPEVARFCEATYTQGETPQGLPILPCIKKALRNSGHHAFGSGATVDLDSVRILPGPGTSTKDKLYVPESSFIEPDGKQYAEDVAAEILVVQMQDEYRQGGQEKSIDELKRSPLHEREREEIKESLAPSFNVDGRCKACEEQTPRTTDRPSV